MFKRRKETSFFFEGQKLCKLDECTAHCVLMSEEDNAWNELKQYLKNNSLTVWCTFIGWDNFLNSTILTGNVYKFRNYLESYIKKNPSEMYHLTDSGRLNIATIQR